MRYTKKYTRNTTPKSWIVVWHMCGFPSLGSPSHVYLVEQEENEAQWQLQFCETSNICTP